MRTMIVSFLAIASMTAGLACDTGDGGVADRSCASGERWGGGNQGSVLMNPGRDCIGCHRGEGPRFAVAGTVYDAADEADGCFGVADVAVHLVGADGKTVTLTSNDAGNFMRSSLDLAMPYTVRLEYEGRERVMTTPQTELDCASCHTAQGRNGAPGRVLAP
ncbi:MAG: hypothetical protein U0168_09480 [Nannocystaceae bacterium]